MSGDGNIEKRAVWTVVALVNLVALFCSANPWFDEWRATGASFFAIEAMLTVIVYLPVVTYQRFVRKRPWGESFTVAAGSLMEIITGAVP